MDSRSMARDYFSTGTERKRIDFYYYYPYSKGVVLVACLPFIILLFTGITAVILYNVIALKTKIENLQAELTSYKNPDVQPARTLPIDSTLPIDNNRKGASSDTSSPWRGTKEVGSTLNGAFIIWIQ